MDFNFKKRYGQNFLNDKNIIDKIVNSIAPDNDDLIIEIGLGSGALTKYLVDKSKYYVGYEIDTEVRKFLSKYESEDNIFIYDDVLKRDIKEDIKDIPYKNLYIIGNLPYYITTPIILKVIDDGLDPKECVFMVQKEVAYRFKAEPKTKDYGSITVLLNYYYDIELLCNVSRTCFTPKPNVDSAVIKFISKKEKNEIDLEMFNRLLKDSFQFKRKNIKNNLKNYDLNSIETILEKHGYNPSNRAEDLPLEIYIEIVKDVLMKK